MSTVAQIYAIVNDVAQQTLGEKAVSVVDTASFISLGDAVLSSQTNTDLFLNTLVDRIGKTVFSVRRYTAHDSGMVRHPFEFGCIVQKIYVDMPEAKENNAWEIGKTGYTPSYAPVIKPSAKQKLFNKISTWEIDVTIPDFMLKTAFLNETSMATFIDAIFVSMDNMMELALENNANLTRAHFIANRLLSTTGCLKVNLLEEYNKLVTTKLTVDTCLRDANFLKWSSMQINLWVKRMRTMSKLFNEEEYVRHTPTDKLVVDVLQDYASATASFLESNTYHDELVKLPMYNEVPYWQGSGTSFAFADTSKINVSIGNDEAVEQSGIIAVIYDHEAIGVTMNERRSTTERNNKDEYTNYYNKCNMGYFVDNSENGIVFYIANSSSK